MDINLNFTIALNQIVSAANALKSALNGDLIPRGIDGVTADNVADLGSATQRWRRVYANHLNIGGSEFNVSGLINSNFVNVHFNSDDTFTWPYTETNCWAWLFSGGSGGGGGGGGGAGASGTLNGRESGEKGFTGDPGEATTITVGSDTYSSGTPPGGEGGDGGLFGVTGTTVQSTNGADGVTDPLLHYYNEIAGGMHGNGGLRFADQNGGAGGHGGDGAPGGKEVKMFNIIGLTTTSVLDITIGAGGDGGPGGDGGRTYAGWHSYTAGFDGSDGADGDDGFAILIAY